MTATSVAAQAPFDLVVSRLVGVKATGKRSCVAICPAHEDRTPSLSITEGRDLRALLNCHAGCETEAVVQAIGLEMSDLYVPRPTDAAAPNGSAPDPRRRPRLVKTYDYEDAEGALLYQACRLVFEDGKKTFRQRRPDGRGDWVWSLGDVPPVLYQLPAVMAAVESGRRVFIVEGEKDADALAALGYVATTNPMGAGKWRETMSAALHGAEVVILPDNDEPGRSHAAQVAASLTAVEATVRVVALPDVPEKGDVSDWLDAGGTLDALEALIGRTPLWTAGGLRRTRWRLDELLDNDEIMRPPPPIVPRLAWAGRSTLLAAREKAGKSTLTGFITACVSNGAPFLGEPCPVGVVLVIGLEEFIGDTARRLRHFGACATRVHLVDRFAGEAEMRPEELRAHIDAVKPSLVIIDSLTAYSHGQIQDDNNATQMAKVVQPLTDVVHQMGCALIIIHHVAKASGKSRGSTAITAAVDVVCEFEIADEEADPTLRRVRSVGRVPVPRVYDVRFDGDTYVLATGTETPLDARIIAIIAERPMISGTDITETIGSRKKDVLNEVARLLATGRIRNVGSDSRPKYVMPGTPVPELHL